MKVTSFLFFVFGIVFISSCAKLPVYESKKYVTSDNEDFLNPITSNYNEKENIHFGVADDDTSLFVKAIFHDRESLMKIMRGGLNIYFDPDGKKGKDYQLKIEKAEVQLTEYELMTRRGNMNLNNPQQNMPATIGLMYNKITWDKNGDRFVFYRNLQNEPVGVKLVPNKQNELVLEIKMPLSELPLSNGQSLFSIGIETGSVSSGNMNSARSMGSMRQSSGGMGGRSGGGGGRGGGMSGGGGGRSGGKSGGSRPGGASPSGVTPIKIWFQVQL